MVRFDERDSVFARERLVPGSPEEQAYHAAHPELVEIDRRIVAFIQEVAHPEAREFQLDAAFYRAAFGPIAGLALPDVVDGDVAATRVEDTPERLAARVKALARYLGAWDVRIGPLNPAWVYSHRVEYGDKKLSIKGKGEAPESCSPITCVVGDRCYEVEVSISVHGSAQGGLLLFYNEKMYCGLGLGGGQLCTYNYGAEHSWMRTDLDTDEIRLRLTNIDNVVTYHTSTDGRTWTKHPWQMEVSGMHHNVFGGFTSLKVALFACGNGSCEFSDFQYRGIT